jgi:hypothetical protein
MLHQVYCDICQSSISYKNIARHRRYCIQKNAFSRDGLKIENDGLKLENDGLKSENMDLKRENDELKNKLIESYEKMLSIIKVR